MSAENEGHWLAPDPHNGWHQQPKHQAFQWLLEVRKLTMNDCFRIGSLGLICVGLILGACAQKELGEDESGAVPSGYESLCELVSDCQTGSTPPDMTVSLTGSGTTMTTSNELWAVGESETFTADLDTSTPGLISGAFDMESFSIEFVQAQYMGAGESFTIYGTDVFEDGDCSMEARVVISGTHLSEGVNVLGELALEFTDNMGAGCDPEVITGYPGTGAIFSFTARVG